jgi:predicted TPR repeat methyltransferase
VRVGSVRLARVPHPEIDIGEQLQQAFAAMSEGRPEAAEERARAVLAVTPNLPPALHVLGLAEHALGRREEGLASLRESLVFAPRDVDTRMNLAILLLQDGDKAGAEKELRFLLSVDPKVIPARGNLAALLEEAGRYAEAKAELLALLAIEPDELAALTLLRRVCFKLEDHEGEIAATKQLLLKTPGDPTLLRTMGIAFHLWFDKVDGSPELARRVAKEWHEALPEDAIARHAAASFGLIEAGKRAPDAFVERYFDEFAPQFEDVLSRLDYRGPKLIRLALERVFPTPSRSLRGVDLGCGTGSTGPLVAPWMKSFVGVDLSSKMLEEAKKKRCYDELVHAELSAFLPDNVEVFDIAVSSDTFVYFGDLEPVLRQVARSLTPDGHFIATFESLRSDDPSIGYVLHRGGRYAHTRAYVERVLADVGLPLLHFSEVALRMEHGAPVAGLVVIARKPA